MTIKRQTPLAPGDEIDVGGVELRLERATLPDTDQRLR